MLPLFAMVSEPKQNKLEACPVQLHISYCIRNLSNSFCYSKFKTKSGSEL